MGKRLKLRAFRAETGLNQSEMAAKLNCSRATYAGIETGQRGGGYWFWLKLQRTFNIPDEKMWGLTKDSENEV